MEKALFSVQELIEYRKKIGLSRKFQVPESIIMCYSRSLIDRIKKDHKTSEIKGIFGNYGELYLIENTDEKIGILAGFGIGAPATVIVTEELIPWGAKRFIILGMAGAISEKLRVGDLVVCTKSIRDEGTSHHYLEYGKYSFSSKALTEKLHQSLVSKFKGTFKGPSWSIDAPYRETVKELKQFRREGILTVDMEASALFAVGRSKAVETSAVFVISDLLSEERWKPRFSSKKVLEKLSKSFDVLSETLKTLR